MKKPALWLALFLFLFAGALLFYRVLFLGYPLLPTAPGQTWAISIDLYVETGTEGAKVALGLPAEQAGLMVVEEKISAGAQSLDIHLEGPNRIGIWSVPGNREKTLVNFQTAVYVKRGRLGGDTTPPSRIAPPAEGGEEEALAKRLVAGWRNLPPPARLRAVAATASGRWADPPSSGRRSFPPDRFPVSCLRTAWSAAPCDGSRSTTARNGRGFGPIRASSGIAESIFSR